MPIGFPQLHKKIVGEVEELARLCGFGKQDVVLDVGCGKGELVKALRLKSFNALGVDVVKHEKMPENSFLIGSAESLPIKSNSVKLLIDSFTMHYTDIDKSASEVLRVLEKGGFALVLLQHAGMVKKGMKKILEQKGLGSDLNAFVSKNAEKLAFEDYPSARLLLNTFKDKEEAEKFFEGKGFKVLEATEELINGKPVAFKLLLKKLL